MIDSLTYVLGGHAVAKKSSIFDDPLKEIQELTALIKNDITSLNVDVSDLQTLQNMEIVDGNYSEDRVVHSTAVCDDLKNKLMGATKKFQDVLTARTEVCFHGVFFVPLFFHFVVTSAIILPYLPCNSVFHPCSDGRTLKLMKIGDKSFLQILQERIH